MRGILALALTLALACPRVGRAQVDSGQGDEPAGEGDDDTGEADGDREPLGSRRGRLRRNFAPLRLAPEDRRACPAPEPCCVPGGPCIHPSGARLALLLTGAGMVGGAAAAVFLAGDSLESGDPAAALGGAGLIALAGAAAGALASLVVESERAVADPAGAPWVEASFSLGSGSVLGEADPASLGVRWAPTFTLPGGRTRLRIFGSASSSLGTSTTVDPRPQTLEGTFPEVLTARSLKVRLGAELRGSLPYPLIDPRRAIWFGPVELVYQPLFEFRQNIYDEGEADERRIEHVALMPFNFGVRWNLSPRQRFILKVGPRLDIISFTEDGAWSRGGLALGPFYGEGWWELDVPLSPRARTQTEANARLSLGYIHSRLDGRGLDIGAAVGFFGPLAVEAAVRVRRRGAPIAAQISAGVWIANNGGAWLRLGLVPPDPPTARRRREAS